MERNLKHTKLEYGLKLEYWLRAVKLRAVVLRKVTCGSLAVIYF